MSRFQDIITSLTPSQRTREMLGAAATTMAAGYFGGTQGVEAVGKIATMKKQLGEQRRLDKIAEVKRKLEEDRTRLEMEQTKQQIAESKARITREDEYKKAAAENLKDQQFGRAAKTGLESAKLMLGATGFGGRGGRVGAVKSGLSKKTPQGLIPPIVPSSTKPEDRTEEYETFGAKVARELFSNRAFKSYQEFTSEQPRLIAELKKESPSMTPQDVADIDREMKNHFAQAFRPDLAERIRQFRSTGEGLKSPPAGLNWEKGYTIPGGIAAGMALGSPFGPVGMTVGGIAGALVGNEAGNALPRDFASNTVNALAKYQPSPGAGSNRMQEPRLLSSGREYYK